MRKLVPGSIILGGVVVTLGMLVIAGVPALAADSDSGSGDGVIVQVARDAVVGGNPASLVVVVAADVTLETEADTLVVVGGDAELIGAEVGTLVVVDGVATLDATTVVGDVWLTEAQLRRSDGSQVTGEIRSGADAGFAGLWLTGLIIALGFAVLVVLAGLFAAGVAPAGLTRAARAIADSPGPTVLAAFAVWLGLPIAGALVALTIVGIPTALAVWVGALPVLALVGYVVTGLRIGQAILTRNEGVGHPYMATFVGVLTLFVVGLVPFIGWLVGIAAAFVGGGAAALVAWRTIRGDRPTATASPLPA